MSSSHGVSCVINNWLHCSYSTLKIYEDIIHEEKAAARQPVWKRSTGLKCSAVTGATKWPPPLFPPSVLRGSDCLSWQQMARTNCCCWFLNRKKKKKDCGEDLIRCRNAPPSLANYYPSRRKKSLRKANRVFLSGCRLSEKYSLSKSFFLLRLCLY